jgi:hypothetical protein
MLNNPDKIIEILEEINNANRQNWNIIIYCWWIIFNVE